MQLVQLQQAQQKFKDQGIGLVAVSYDSVDILKDFATRQHITFPLLSDPHSEIIGKYNVLDTEAKGPTQGMAHPGFVYIDSAQHVKEKFFEAGYIDRYTANNVIARLFPELTEQVQRKVDAPHVALVLEQSDPTGIPGSRITLTAEVELGPDVHVYAPGVKGYIPVEFKLNPVPEFKAGEVKYPEAKVLFLDAIKESVPVFAGKFRISQDVTIAASREFMKSIGQGKTISIHGEFKYQACDKTVCYKPASAPVTWEVAVLPLDLQRSPEAIQHK
jgi:hypothetical protein